MAEQDVVAEAVVAGEPDNHSVVTDGNPQGASDWAKGLDEATTGKVSKFKTPADLAKAYVELETTFSKPFQDMTPDQQEKYLKRLGLPESAEGYELSNITLPGDQQRAPASAAEFRVLLKTLKLTKDQGKGLDEWLMKRAAESITATRTAIKRQAEERESALRTSWGASFDGNNAEVDKIMALGGEAFVAEMNAGPGKNPVVRVGLYAISKLMANETLVTGAVKGKTGTEVPSGFVFDPSQSPELQR